MAEGEDPIRRAMEEVEGDGAIKDTSSHNNQSNNSRAEKFKMTKNYRMAASFMQAG